MNGRGNVEASVDPYVRMALDPDEKFRSAAEAMARHVRQQFSRATEALIREAARQTDSLARMIVELPRFPVNQAVLELARTTDGVMRQWLSGYSPAQPRTVMATATFGADARMVVSADVVRAEDKAAVERRSARSGPIPVSLPVLLVVLLLVAATVLSQVEPGLPPEVQTRLNDLLTAYAVALALAPFIMQVMRKR